MIDKCYFYFNKDTDSPYKTLALEETMLNNIKKGEIILYLYKHTNAVIIGKNQNAWQECRTDKLKEAGGVIARRISGGGAVYHDAGNLNFSFIVDKECYDLNRQLSVIAKAAESFGIPAHFSGRNDILADDKKFSGNAFCFKKHSSFHHGTILINSDMDKLTSFLNVSEDKIRSKGIKSVRSRVCNLCDFKSDLTTDDFAYALKKAFESEYAKSDEYIITDNIINESKIYEERNKTWEWIYGYTGNFDITMKKRFAWGGIEICLMLKDAYIKEATIYSDAMDAEFISLISDKIKDLPFKAADLSEAISSAARTKEQQNIASDISELIHSTTT